MKAIFFDCFDDFLYLEWSLAHLELSELAHHLKDRTACDARQNRSIERRRKKFVLTILIFPEDKKIHGANFSDIIVQKPQSLITAMQFLTRATDFQSGSIVSANFLVSKTLGPRSHDFGIAIQLDWLETSRIVWSNRAQANERFHSRN